MTKAYKYSLVLLGIELVGCILCSVQGQEPKATKAPVDPAILAEGQTMFRGLCSGCHGGAGRGGKGPDLTRKKLSHGNTDEEIANVIRNGVPKTTMKKLGDSLKEDQIAKLVLFIRSLQSAPAATAWKPYLAGDPKAGRLLFADPKGKAQCIKCHSVGGDGGRVGPPLDRIASRRTPEYIMESILEPSKDIDPQYESLQVVTKKGTIIVGLRVNQTNFSVQLREIDGRFHSFDKNELDEVNVLKKSIMPENMAELLTVKELHDVFAYLMTLE